MTLEPGRDSAAGGSAVAPDGDGELAVFTTELCASLQGPAASPSAAELAPLIEELAAAAAAGADLDPVHAARIADIDALLGAQVNDILHAAPFQRLEAAWRGLTYLVSQTEISPMLKVRVLHASKADLRKDLEGASEFDQSALFKKVYEEEYGMFGGEPFATLIGDYEFSNHPQDIALLERISSVAAAAHAPFFAAASPGLFGWESFSQLSVPVDLARIFTSAEYVKWRALRDSEDMRYVGLTLPRILLREPYTGEVAGVASFCFQEEVSGADHAKYLWGNAAFALGGRLADAFARTGWCAAIRGVDGGGLVRGLPSPAVETDAGRVVVKGPLEIAVSESKEKDLADLGFIPLAHCKGTDYAVFYSTQSCQRPKRYDNPEANANARLSTQLQYILATSRFAHYLKVMMRDKTGAATTAGDGEDYLNRWLSEYCLGNPESADIEARARKPLRDGRVTVREVRGKPGAYEAVIHLQPHFQLEELTVSLRLVTELPAPVERR
jgi:type VI secretion system protein ImpC